MMDDVMPWVHSANSNYSDASITRRAFALLVASVVTLSVFAAGCSTGKKNARDHRGVDVSALLADEMDEIDAEDGYDDVEIDTTTSSPEDLAPMEFEPPGGVVSDPPAARPRPANLEEPREEEPEEHDSSADLTSVGATTAADRPEHEGPVDEGGEPDGMMFDVMLTVTPERARRREHAAFTIRAERAGETIETYDFDLPVGSGICEARSWVEPEAGLEAIVSVECCQPEPGACELFVAGFEWYEERIGEAEIDRLIDTAGVTSMKLVTETLDDIDEPERIHQAAIIAYVEGDVPVARRVISRWRNDAKHKKSWRSRQLDDWEPDTATLLVNRRASVESILCDDTPGVASACSDDGRPFIGVAVWLNGRMMWTRLERGYNLLRIQQIPPAIIGSSPEGKELDFRLEELVEPR